MFTSEKELDTIEDPQNNHTIGDQGGSWTTSLKSVRVQCFNGVLTRHPMFWEKIHFEKSESTNLHKHQKKNKVEVEETSTGTKKKQRNFPATMGPLLGRCWKFCFFFVPVQVWCFQWFGVFCFFWCLPMFCEVRVTKPAKAPKKTKQTKWKWRKHRQAPKTKNKISSNYGPTSGQVLGNVDLFFLCLCRFGASSGLVFF